MRWVRRPSQAHPQRHRLEALALLSRPGCVLCREGQLAVDRFFFWYLHEHYSEPQSLVRVEQSRGFCREHTKTLLDRASASTLACVYGHLFASALERLQQAERQLSSPSRSWEPAPVAAALMPRASCPACASRDEHREYLVHLLRRTVSDPEVARALRSGPAICLAHFVEIAPYLDRLALSSLAGLVHDALLAGPPAARSVQEAPHQAGAPQPAYGEAQGSVAVPGCEEAQGSTADPGIEQVQGSGTDPGDGEAAAARPGWSPALGELRRLLATPGCPIDAAQQRATRGYLAWLAQEVRRSPPYAWNDALWLCGRHRRDFELQADEEARERLARARAEYWAGQLAELRTALDDAPPEALPARLGWVRRSLGRAQPEPALPPAGGRSPRATVRVRAAWGALHEAMRPAGHVLRAVRERYLRAGECPVCRYLDTVAERTFDLLVRALDDPGTFDAYEASSGVCFRHLPRLLRAAPTPEAAKRILRVQRLRLEVLQWELTEFDRKQNWAVRYEPLGPEASASSRAVNHYSGASWGTLD